MGDWTKPLRGVMTVDVRKSKYLCNPADKNGEDPTAPTHTDHLMCYQTRSSGRSV